MPDRRFRPICTAVGAGLLLFLAACAPGKKLIGNPEEPYPPVRERQIGDIFHPATGSFVTPEVVIDFATRSRIVYVAETHDNPASHRMQEELIRALSAQRPGKIAIGMEMLTPAQDTVLAAWVKGELDEKELLKQLDWYRIWSQDFDYYRDIFLAAKELGIPMIGLNANKETVKALRGKSFDEARADGIDLPEIGPDDFYQRAMATSIFAGHDATESMIEGFLRVQTLWDETMAESIATYLASPDNEEKTLVVLAGGNHIRNGFGIPRRVFRRLPVPYLLIGGSEIVPEGEKEDRYMDVTLPSFPMPAYDFVYSIPYDDLPVRGVKLGVWLKDEDGVVSIRKIVEGSAAETNGLLEGDILKAIDGEPIRESIDLTFPLKQHQLGDRVELEIERNGETMQKEVHFPKEILPKTEKN